MPVKNIRHIRKLLFASILLTVAADAQEDDLFALQNPADVAAEETAVDAGTLDQPIAGETVAEEALVEEALVDEILADEYVSDQTNIDAATPDAEFVPQEMALEEQDADAAAGSSTSSQADLEPGPLDQIVPVADEELAADIDLETDAGELTDEERLIAEFERYKELMSDGVYDEADTVAKRVVELAARTIGPKSLETAKALTNLAIVQHHNQQFVPAQQNFQASIEIIEDADNRLSAHLVNPLKGLGAAQLESGRPDLALGTFGRAMHITHVNEGPHNLYQLELLQSLAEVNLRLGETSDARELQERMYLLNIRQHEDDSMALIPALMQRAAWQHRVGLIIDERSTYRRVIQIIEKNEGKQSLLLVTPLVSYGRSFFYSDMSGTIDTQVTSVSSGEMFFKRALRITEDNPGASWRLRASTTLALGDYYSFIGSDNRARRTYTDAWEMLSDDEEQLKFRKNMLENVVLLEEKPIPEYIRSDSPADSDELLTATLTMSYEINPRGRVGSLKLLEADPVVFPQMMRAVQRILRTRAYRPRYEDAQPVASPDQLLVHTYYYRQSDLDALQEPGD